MSLTLPVSRNIVISEKRDYTLTYSFCEQSAVPESASIIAKAFPRFSEDTYFEGFLGASSSTPVRRFFSAGESLWRVTGEKTGQLYAGSPVVAYSIATKIEDASAVSLSFSLSGGRLSVLIPFGSSFSRMISPVSGAMSKDDMALGNSPARYIYAVMSGAAAIGSGYIDITIDLSDVGGGSGGSAKTKETTLCSVGVS